MSGSRKAQLQTFCINARENAEWRLGKHCRPCGIIKSWWLTLIPDPNGSGRLMRAHIPN